MLATAGVKGFALMLMIGTLISLITAVAATRAMLGLLAGFRWFDNPRFMGATGQTISMSGTGGQLAFLGAGTAVLIDRDGLVSGRRAVTGGTRAADVLGGVLAVRAPLALLAVAALLVRWWGDRTASWLRRCAWPGSYSVMGCG